MLGKAKSDAKGQPEQPESKRRAEAHLNHIIWATCEQRAEEVRREPLILSSGQNLAAGWGVFPTSQTLTHKRQKMDKKCTDRIVSLMTT